MNTRIKTILCVAAALAATTAASAMSHPVMLEDQGSFFAGGVVKTAPGAYTGQPLDRSGETLHGDHAYVFYQKPVKAHQNALVFLHGAGQSSKTWETTPDGRDGFQNMFLERGYTTYLVDQPRRGKAGQTTITHTVTAQPEDQMCFNIFRLGTWPKFYDNVQVARDERSLDQFFRQMTPNTGDFDQEVISDAMVAVLETAGPSVLVTHSQGGGPGWETAMKSDKVKGVISFEPGDFPFPEGEVPPAEPTRSPFPAQGSAVSMDEFLKMTKIPVAVVYGDNIPAEHEHTDNWGMDNWRIRLNLARKWVDIVNRYGGNAELIYLPDRGIYGNTHFPFADLNNKEVADVMEQWMKDNGLAE